jgi:uncharacterized circularly permuted ATP-grasp superfamily protein
MLIGPHATQKERDAFKEKILTDPRGYIAQPMISRGFSFDVIKKAVE